VALALVAAGLTVAAGRAGDASTRPAPVERHVVRAGETLWGIARGLADPGSDPRPLIQDLRRANGLAGSALAEGQVLVLP
jgi:LysM repeat protein